MKQEQLTSKQEDFILLREDDEELIDEDSLSNLDNKYYEFKEGVKNAN